MGGRRKSNKIQKREKPLLVRTQFDCRVCGFKNGIQIKIKKQMKLGLLQCLKCGQNWSCQVRLIDENIDVYHKWINFLRNKRNIKQDVEPQYDSNHEDVMRNQNKKKKEEIEDDIASIEVSDESLLASEQSSESVKPNKKEKKPSPEKQPLLSDSEEVDEDNSFSNSEDDSYEQQVQKRLKIE